MRTGTQKIKCPRTPVWTRELLGTLLMPRTAPVDPLKGKSLKKLKREVCCDSTVHKRGGSMGIYIVVSGILTRYCPVFLSTTLAAGLDTNADRHCFNSLGAL